MIVILTERTLSKTTQTIFLISTTTNHRTQQKAFFVFSIIINISTTPFVDGTAFGEPSPSHTNLRELRRKFYDVSPQVLDRSDFVVVWEGSLVRFQSLFTVCAETLLQLRCNVDSAREKFSHLNEVGFGEASRCQGGRTHTNTGRHQRTLVTRHLHRYVGDAVAKHYKQAGK